MTNSLPELADAKCIFIIGSNPTENHPIAANWILRGREKGAQITGIDPATLRKMAEIHAKNKPAAIIYCMGVTQHTTGVDNVKSSANPAMLTGNLGLAPGGVNPLRGQNNAQGAYDMGGLPNVFTGCQPKVGATRWGDLLSLPANAASGFSVKNSSQIPLS